MTSIEVSQASTRTSDSQNQSHRIDVLESKMGQVDANVNSIDAKLDLLIAAAAPTPVCSTPRKPTPQPEDTRNERLPPPRTLRREVDSEGYVKKMLQEARFKTNPVEGKRNVAYNIFAETAIPKPYMYIEREACQTIKQKLDARASFSAMEYVHASLALVNDTRAYENGDKAHILHHIQDVVHDAIERPMGCGT